MRYTVVLPVICTVVFELTGCSKQNPITAAVLPQTNSPHKSTITPAVQSNRPPLSVSAPVATNRSPANEAVVKKNLTAFKNVVTALTSSGGERNHDDRAELLEIIRTDPTFWNNIDDRDKPDTVYKLLYCPGAWAALEEKLGALTNHPDPSVRTDALTVFAKHAGREGDYTSADLYFAQLADMLGPQLDSNDPKVLARLSSDQSIAIRNYYLNRIVLADMAKRHQETDNPIYWCRKRLLVAQSCVPYPSGPYFCLANYLVRDGKYEEGIQMQERGIENCKKSGGDVPNEYVERLKDWKNGKYDRGFSLSY